jgi:DNA-binding PucR family transcriptional regulator
LRDDGVFRRLWAGEVVRYEAPDVEGFAPRLAVAVRAGDEVLGSIWVAESGERLGPEAELALVRAAHVAALHLVHRRAASDVQRVVRGEHLRSLLDGHGSVEPLAAILDLDPRAPFLVLAAKLVADDDQTLEAARELTVGLASLHIGFFRPRATSVVMGDVVYVLVPDEPSLPPDTLEGAARAIAERLGQQRGVHVRIAIGPRVEQLADIKESRRVADLGLRILERMPHVPVASTEELADQILLLETAEACKRWPELLHGKLDVLVAHDEEHGTEYVRTLRAYLDAFGDVALAADCLGVHPNTFRYRLHRIVKLADLDLDDPDERLAVELRLRFR